MNIKGNNQYKRVPIYHDEKVIAHLSYPSKYKLFKRFIWRWVKRIVALLVIASIGYIIYVVGQYNTTPKTVIVEKPVTVEIVAKAPVLDRIAQCESGNTQYAKNGQVLLRANDNGSVDIGVMQINNAIWGAKATALGYNLFIEADNRAMAEYIYQNYGTSPWVLSSHCWTK